VIPLAEPNLAGNESRYVRQAIASGWISGGGPFVERFEEMVAKACGRRWCVATLTGTDAIHLAQTACGLRRDMRVDMPSMAYIGAANAVKAAGGTIHFRDITDGWTYDRTVLGGVVDAAPAVGIRQEGLVICLSFNGNKTITTGQGGAVLGNELEFGSLVRHLGTMAKTGPYEYDAAGFNYPMTNLTAAMGCAQMERLKPALSRKRDIWRRYREALRPAFPGVRSQSCWMATLRTEKRGAMLAHLRKLGIDARPFWTPLHMLAPYRNCHRDPLPITEAIWDKLVCLPCSTGLTEGDQDKVIAACAAFLSS